MFLLWSLLSFLFWLFSVRFDFMVFISFFCIYLFISMVVFFILFVYLHLSFFVFFLHSGLNFHLCLLFLAFLLYFPLFWHTFLNHALQIMFLLGSSSTFFLGFVDILHTDYQFMLFGLQKLLLLIFYFEHQLAHFSFWFCCCLMQSQGKGWRFSWSSDIGEMNLKIRDYEFWHIFVEKMLYDRLLKFVCQPILKVTIWKTAEP